MTIFWLVVAFLGLWEWAIYNSLVRRRQRVKEAWADIDVQLRRRYNLIPNLVETVKGYAKHEKSIMTEVSEARKALVSAKNISNKIKANDVLTSTLGKLFAIAENYPNLKANENFLELQKELSSTEDRVAYSRQNYNDSVLSYNNMTEKFPGTVFAGIFNKKRKTFIEIAPTEKEVPKVKF